MRVHHLQIRGGDLRIHQWKARKEDGGSCPSWGESMEMLGIIGKLGEKGLHHARPAQTRRSPAMRVQPAMEVEERPDAASSPGSPCSLVVFLVFLVCSCLVCSLSALDSVDA